MYNVLNWSLGSRGLNTVADLGFGQGESRKNSRFCPHTEVESGKQSDLILASVPEALAILNCQIYAFSHF